WNLPILHEPGLSAHTHQRSDIVEQIHEKECENYFQQSQVESATQIKLKKSSPRMGHGDKRARTVSDSAQQPEQHGPNDSQQNAAIDPAHHQHEREQDSEACGLHLCIGKAA